MQGNKLVELDDVRLPFEFVRWYNQNYNNSRIISVLPQDRAQVFVSGASNKAIFEIATAAHFACHILNPFSLSRFVCSTLLELNSSSPMILMELTAPSSLYLLVISSIMPLLPHHDPTLISFTSATPTCFSPR